MNMPALVMRAFALVAIATFLAASTGCDRNYRKKSAELKALLDTAQREYSARRWDLRKKAIAGVRAFFQGVDARDPAQFEKTKEYRMIGDFLATSSRDIYASVRIESLKAIAILRYEPAFDRVGEMALNDQDDNVRWQAVETLSLYRSEKSIDILTRTLRSDDWVIREASIRGMLMLDESVQRGRLIPYISEAILDPNDNVSRAALAGAAIRDQQLYKTTADV
ncbi:MAG TPA: HEAT repeat domain-containing protein, partial [Spirochaetota bacterium]|nr:HEAT repeat domain-containing protein [Spirochaetota bacterium]